MKGTSRFISIAERLKRNANIGSTERILISRRPSADGKGQKGSEEDNL
jgi:hypothetical protein